MPLLQPLGKQAQALAIPLQQLDDVAPSAAKDEHVSREQGLGKSGLRQSGQTIKSFAHVGHSSGQPDPRSHRQADHPSAARICTMLRSSARSKPADKCTVAPATLISIAGRAEPKVACIEALRIATGGAGSMVIGSRACKVAAGRRWLRRSPRQPFANHVSVNAVAQRDGGNRCAGHLALRNDLALELLRVGAPAFVGFMCRSWHAYFGVRYVHGGRYLYATCLIPQGGIGRTLTRRLQ